MPRVVSLYLPSWPTDRLRRVLGVCAPPPDAPLILVGSDGGRRAVMAANSVALTLGVRLGMPVTQAQALHTSLVVMDADSEADTTALDRLALWALRRYAPIAAADPPDGLVVDVTGAAHLHGGEEAMLADMVARLTAVGVAARAAIADSWGAAHAVARFGSGAPHLVMEGLGEAQLATLPIAALRLPADMVQALRVLGFRWIGQLAHQPRAPLALRFGPLLGRRVDQAYGRTGEPITPIQSPELIGARRGFAEPIGAAETIARYIGQLVAELCIALEANGLGARRLDLICHRVDDGIQAVRVGLAKPVCDPPRLTRLLCDKIETIDPGFGIEIMTLTATLAEPLVPRQVVSDFIEEPEADIAGLIDTLVNRVGEDRLYRFTSVSSDVPERAVGRVAPMDPQIDAAWPLHWPRPTRLFAQPEAIEALALLPDHPPAAFVWRGTRRRVKRADGPERVFGEWWKRDAELEAVRDYFQVEDEAGQRFWIYRAGDGEHPETGSQRWFLHGVFG